MINYLKLQFWELAGKTRPVAGTRQKKRRDSTLIEGAQLNWFNFLLSHYLRTESVNSISELYEVLSPHPLRFQHIREMLFQSLARAVERYRTSCNKSFRNSYPSSNLQKENKHLSGALRPALGSHPQCNPYAFTAPSMAQSLQKKRAVGQLSKNTKGLISRMQC